ncbi:response regulator transcription factor [Abyssalbus ytuae]|uniref:Response regulator transcription factor n=1 Tax=Abyssalbus ytuae TaxID=2926907 RepID=A0A9E6ZNV7_9FLAO|nr:response regulator transcription factor [Abyssalbus ytuae]UOB19337.1 response regulator transcription factor [Abyssalbus ytuae]
MTKKNSDIKNIKVIIADDHPMMLQGLKATLEQGGINVLGMAREGTEALKLILESQPDLAILDIDMPYLSGFDIAQECLKRNIQTKFIILSFHKEAEFIAQAKKINISGYLLKEDTSMVIFDCIREVIAGKMYFSQSILNNDLSFVNKKLERLASLSPSEKKILKLIAEQHTSQQIAQKLHISTRTVEKHRSNIISKLDISGYSNSLSIWAIDQKALLMNL